MQNVGKSFQLRKAAAIFLTMHCSCCSVYAFDFFIFCHIFTDTLVQS